MQYLEQAYASGNINQIILETLELHHPVFTNDAGVSVPIRYVSSQNITVPVLAPLEASAPINGGDWVEFIPAPIGFAKPKRNNQGYTDLGIAVGVTTLEIEMKLDEAADHPDPIKAFFRIYCMDDTGKVSGPENKPFEWTIAGSVTERGRLSASATLTDIINRPFPFFIYTPQFAPGLVRT